MVQKWYVVTVGKEIGVFDNWIEVAPLVKGVSGAVYQGFKSREEACMIFEKEGRKGNTRIVHDSSSVDAQSHSVGPQWISGATPIAEVGQKFYAMGISPTEARMFSTHSSRQNGTLTAPPTGSKAPRQESPRSISSSSTSKLNKQSSISPLESRSSNRRTASSTTAVVRSPSWLPSYPSNSNGKANQSPLLSPLSVHAKVSLDSSQSMTSSSDILYTREGIPSSRVHFSARSRQPHNASAPDVSTTDTSDDEDPIILHRPTRKTGAPGTREGTTSNGYGIMQAHNIQAVYDSRSDPRSPMGRNTVSPLPANSALFGRPSPCLTSIIVATN